MVGGENAVFAREKASLQYAPGIVDKVWKKAQSLGYGKYFSDNEGGYIIDDHVYVNKMGIPSIDIIQYDASSDYDDMVTSIKSYAQQQGVSEDEYCKSVFGSDATLEGIKPYVEMSGLASAYYNDVKDDIEVTDDEINTYYDENKDNYDSVDYRVCKIEADMPEEETETETEAQTETAAESISETAAESTSETAVTETQTETESETMSAEESEAAAKAEEEAKKAAMAAAKAKADEIGRAHV